MTFNSKKILMQIVAHRDVLLQHMSAHGRDAIFPPRLQKMCKDGMEKILIELALVNDYVSAIEAVLFSLNGTRRVQFEDYHKFLLNAAKLFKRRDKKLYGEFINLVANDCERFLEIHYTDQAPFGGANRRTQWMGLQITANLDRVLENGNALKSYKQIFESTVLPLLDENESISDVLELAGVWGVLNRDVASQQNLSNGKSTTTSSADHKFEIADLNSSAVLFDIIQNNSASPRITLNSQHGAFQNGHTFELLLRAWAEMETSAWDRRKQMLEDIRSDWGRVARDLVQNEGDGFNE